MCHIYPNYFFENNCDELTKEAIKCHCINLQEQARYEDKIEDLKNKKELQIRRLEQRIHNYYQNKYKNCKCFQTE
jgi:hypothetical protein